MMSFLKHAPDFTAQFLIFVLLSCVSTYKIACIEKAVFQRLFEPKVISIYVKGGGCTIRRFLIYSSKSRQNTSFFCCVLTEIVLKWILYSYILWDWGVLCHRISQEPLVELHRPSDSQFRQIRQAIRKRMERLTITAEKGKTAYG